MTVVMQSKQTCLNFITMPLSRDLKSLLLFFSSFHLENAWKKYLRNVVESEISISQCGCGFYYSTKVTLLTKCK